MSKITSFRELLVWQKSIDLAVRCHAVARRLHVAIGRMLNGLVRSLER